MQEIKEAAPRAARALQQWYAADPYARKAGLYRYDDPSLAVDWKNSSRLGRNLVNCLLAVTGQRDRVQDISLWRRGVPESNMDALPSRGRPQ